MGKKVVKKAAKPRAPKQTLVSSLDFGKQVGVSRQAIDAAIDNGRITAIRLKRNRRMLVLEEALEEWKKIGGGMVQKSGRAADKNDKPENSNSDEATKSDDKITYTEALRREKVFAAEKKELEVKELKGELVRKKTVYKELFAAGQEVRAALQTLPDKHIDDILACDNRQEAHAVLTEAINKALESLHFKNIKL